MHPILNSIVCPQHVDCEAPISVITQILSKNDPSKYQNISNEFDKLGFTKVKDLAGATLGKVISIKLSENFQDTINEIYGAMEIYTKNQYNLLVTAQLEYHNQNFTETQNICKELLTHKPNDVKVLLLNADCFYSCGNYDECINCLEKAKNINPDCRIVLNKCAIAYMKNSEYDLAKQYLFKICEANPLCCIAWTNYADILLVTNDLNSAVEGYARVLDLKPELYGIRNKYGKLLIQLNKVKEGKKQFKIALSYAKDCPETLNNLANVDYKMNKFEKAIAKYKKLLEIKPDMVSACLMLGMAYIKCKEYQNAANTFLQASALEPENVTVLRNLAVTYCLQKNMILSVEIYKMCLMLLPETFDFNLELGLMYLHNIQNYQEAAICFKKCTEINPERIDVYKYLFAAYRLVNDYLNAFDTCMTLGDLYLECDDLENARNAFFCAILMDPSNVFGHWKLGLVLYNLGLLDLALERYKYSIFLKPDFADVYCDIGIIFDARGLSEDAKKYYQMAIKLKGTTHINAELNLDYLLQKITLEDASIDDESENMP